jgi:hypothetical protein
MAAVLGIPGKLDVSGTDVATLIAEGQTLTVHAYCLHDVMTTGWIYAAMAYNRGWWSKSQLDKFSSSAVHFLETQRGTHWDPWREAFHRPSWLPG